MFMLECRGTLLRLLGELVSNTGLHFIGSIVQNVRFHMGGHIYAD